MALCCYTSKEVQIYYDHKETLQDQNTKHFIRTFEVEAESYDKALDLMDIYDGQDEDAYPVDVERVGWWFDGYGKTVLDQDEEHKGLFGIPITEEEAEKTPYYDLVKQRVLLGDYREPTEEEILAEEKQAVR